MTNYLELLKTAQQQLDEERYTPSINKLINAVLEFDRTIKSVALIVNGRTVRQNDFQANIIDILDIIDNDSKKSIKDDVEEILESNRYEVDKLIISDTVVKKIKRCNAVLFVDTEPLEITKDGNTLITHRWRLVNSK